MSASHATGPGPPAPAGGSDNPIIIDSSPEPEGKPDPVLQDPARAQAFDIVIDPRHPAGWRRAMPDLSRGFDSVAARQGPNDEGEGQDGGDGSEYGLPEDDPADNGRIDEYPRAELVMPDFGVHEGDPAISMMRYILHDTMSSMNLRRSESLTIMYADGSWRRVSRVMPRGNVLGNNFIFHDHSHEGEIVGAAEVSANGSRSYCKGSDLCA